MLSTDPSSLKGYDMAISISEDAINKQFRALYDKEIETSLMPTPEQLTGYAPLPAPKHYINHQISIQPCTLENWDDMKPNKRPVVRPESGQFWKNSKTRIEGTIDAPTVTFGEELGNFRCVRVHLKFLTGKLYYLDGDGDEDFNTLDGSTLSWIADLSQTPVKDVMEEIFHASKDTANPTLVAPEVLEKLKALNEKPNTVDEKFKTVNEEQFAVTALFCLFQSIRIVNSFHFFDYNGANKRGSAASNEAVNLLSQYFEALSRTPSTAATPNNPFVLGYGLSQAVPKQTAEQRERGENAPYFVPKEFDLTVTKGDGVYSRGVINYCIVTHRPESMAPSNVDCKKDISAGFWEAGDTPYKRIRANGFASGADGVITFSRGIFKDLWLREHFLSKFKVDIAALSKSVVPPGDTVATAPSLQSSNTSEGSPSNNQLSVTQTFSFNPMACQEMDTEQMKKTENLGTFLTFVLNACKFLGIEMKYNVRRVANGNAVATLTYTSDVQKNPKLDKDSDANRKIYFDVSLQSSVTITAQASGICNIHRLAEDKLRLAKWIIPGMALASLEEDLPYYIGIFTNWTNARQANIEIKTKVGMDMAPAEDTWKLTRSDDKDRTTLPFGSAELKKQSIGPTSYSTLENFFSKQKSSDTQRMQEDGVIVELQNHEMFKEFGTMNGMENFAKPANQWASDYESRLEDQIGALTDGLLTKLILPAGNIFEFKSLNTDPEGHVYSLLTYKTPSALKVNAR